MYINRSSNITNGHIVHSPYYIPNFNYTYFNSPNILNNPNVQSYNSSFISPNKINNSKNNSFYSQNTNINYEQPINQKESEINDKNLKEDSNTNSNFFDFDRIFKISENNLSIFGFSISIDDLIIIGLLIFLIFEQCEDIYLIILLGLLFFDIKLDFWR